MNRAFKSHLTSKNALRLALMASAIAMPTLSHAQSADSNEPAASMEEILVTARKRTERLIDVPAAIAVVTGDQLAKSATSNFQSMASTLPQVMITPSMGASTGANITIRGFGSNAAADSAIEQAVSMSIDNVSSARGRLVTQALFDLESVQVLKGPQALYFGKNSPAGVIVVDSKGPTSKLEGYGTAGYEFKSREYRVEGAVGGPISDTLGFRIAGFHSDMSRGYVENIAQPIPSATSPVAYDRLFGIDIPGAAYKWGPQSKQTAARLTLRYEPSSDFDATLKVTYAQYRSNGDSSAQVNTSCPVGSNLVQQTDLGDAVYFPPAPNIVTDPYNSCGEERRVQAVGRLPQVLASTIPDAEDGVPYLTTKAWLASLTINAALDDNVTLTSVTGFYQGRMRNLLAADNTSYTLIAGTYREKARSLTQEFRLNSDFDGPLDFAAGVFFADEKLDNPFASGLIRAADPRPQFAGVINQATGVTFSDGNTYSMFGELRYNITPELELAGGARGTIEKKNALLVNTYVNAIGAAFGVTLGQGIEVPGRTNESNLSPQVTLSYKVTPDVTVFAGYRTGFKSGGVIHPGLIPATVNPARLNPIPVTYGKETVKGGEAGIKFQTADRRLSGSLTAYHFVYKGLQVSAFDTNTNVVFLRNAGSAKSTGVEGDFNFQANDVLSLHGAFGYNNGRYGTFNNAACFGGQTAAQGCVGSRQDLSGRPLMRAPKWSLNGGATIDVPISGNIALGASVDGRYTSGYFHTPQNSPFAYQKGYPLLDAAIRIHDIDDKWDVSLIGRNLTNEFYAVVSSDKPLARSPGSVYSQLGLPRTVTLQTTYRF